MIVTVAVCCYSLYPQWSYTLPHSNEHLSLPALVGVAHSVYLDSYQDLILTSMYQGSISVCLNTNLIPILLNLIGNLGMRPNPVKPDYFLIILALVPGKVECGVWELGRGGGEELIV